jgi:hypothetical protein
MIASYSRTGNQIFYPVFALAVGAMSNQFLLFHDIAQSFCGVQWRCGKLSWISVPDLLPSGNAE